jgi:hypothetical protein
MSRHWVVSCSPRDNGSKPDLRVNKCRFQIGPRDRAEPTATCFFVSQRSFSDFRFDITMSFRDETA